MFLRPSTRALAVVSRVRRSHRMCFSSFHPHVQSTLNQLDSLAPRFPLTSDQIEVLHRPADFYEALKQRILTAERRVFLATLYVGRSETELVDCLDRALGKNPDLEVHILTDALRGTREAPGACSASLLAALVEKHGKRRVHVCMYHTPNLHGVRKQVVPRRFNEGWGLQHMKLYGFDDEIILSGANLSRDYFTNRQDRYMVFRSRALTDYYFRVHQTVAGLSYRVLPSTKRKAGFVLDWPHVYTLPEPTVDPVNYVREASKALCPLLGPQNTPSPPSAGAEGGVAEAEGAQYLTYVYPVSQFSQLFGATDRSTELTALARVLSMAGTDRFGWTLTAGYFNIHPMLRDKLLNTAPARPPTVITAAPEANGFYRSPGVSGLLPAAYSQLAMNFLDEARRRNKQVDLLEWKRGVVNTPDGWSYHAKGLWITNPDEEAPFLTVVGSSNYTRRAYTHDLETNLLLVTCDPVIQQALKTEVDNLKQHTTKMERQDFEHPDRKPDWRQKTFIKFMGDKL